GSIYALNALTQFLFMNTVMRRVRSDANMHRLIQIGVLLSSLVFLAYYTSSIYMHIVPAQILLGISWSMLYLGSLYILLNRSSDGERASSTALLESSMSISIIIGSLIGGLVAEFAGLRSVMLLSSFLCLTSFMVSVNWRGGITGMKIIYNIDYAKYARMIKYLKI
ncbi:MAG: MFS transporter, partial [Candidatus Nitrosocaldus sp.]